MNSITYTDDWRNNGKIEIIDVRSPSEFKIDHIPGSINIPILNDEERHKVGTTYKQVNPFKAKILGASLISKNISKFLNTVLSNKKGSWSCLIYCWRGGQRSRSLAIILNEIGWRVKILKGGYKSYRKKIINELKVMPKFDFKIIQAQTGTAKTKILDNLNSLNAQVLDLERLAKHRGSLLGKEIKESQPSQKYFETLIHENLNKLNPSKPVFLESESSKIGDLHLPIKLWEKLNLSERILLRAPVRKRVEFLINEYKHLTDDPSLIKPFINGMKGRYSNAKIKYWSELIENKSWDDFVQNILEIHYDPMYAYSEKKHFEKITFKLNLNNLDKLTIDNTAKKILNYFQ
tara:strand:- start:22 stop:1065 length:1044 start_codon:yes stop_codon:yes gene_type:complete